MVVSGSGVDRKHLQDYFYYLVYDAYGEEVAERIFPEDQTYNTENAQKYKHRNGNVKVAGEET